MEEELCISCLAKEMQAHQHDQGLKVGVPWLPDRGGKAEAGSPTKIMMLLSMRCASFQVMQGINLKV